MFKWNVFAPARPAAYAFAFALIGALAVVATGSNSVAEEKKAAPPPKKKDAPKAAPKQEPQQAQPETPQLIFSPWTKFCLKGQRQIRSRCASPARTVASNPGSLWSPPC